MFKENSLGYKRLLLLKTDIRRTLRMLESNERRYHKGYFNGIDYRVGGDGNFSRYIVGKNGSHSHKPSVDKVFVSMVSMSRALCCVIKADFINWKFRFCPIPVDRVILRSSFCRLYASLDDYVSKVLQPLKPFTFQSNPFGFNFYYLDKTLLYVIHFLGIEFDDVVQVGECAKMYEIYNLYYNHRGRHDVCMSRRKYGAYYHRNRHYNNRLDFKRFNMSFNRLRSVVRFWLKYEYLFGVVRLEQHGNTLPVNSQKCKSVVSRNSIISRKMVKLGERLERYVQE
jgi:hypothetical protein